MTLREAREEGVLKIVGLLTKKLSDTVQNSSSGKLGASSPLRLPHLLSLAVDFRK
jgi:hypothetical protein